MYLDRPWTWIGVGRWPSASCWWRCERRRAWTRHPPLPCGSWWPACWGSHGWPTRRTPSSSSCSIGCHTRTSCGPSSPASSVTAPGKGGSTRGRRGCRRGRAAMRRGRSRETLVGRRRRPPWRRQPGHGLPPPPCEEGWCRAGLRGPCAAAGPRPLRGPHQHRHARRHQQQVSKDPPRAGRQAGQGSPTAAARGTA